MSSVSVSSDLGEALEGLDITPLIPEIEILLGEAWLDWKDEITGSGSAPGTVWPIDTGRSLRGWAPSLDGFTLTVSNPVGYAQYTRRAGHPVGAAASDAGRRFEEITLETGEDIADLVEEHLANG